MKRKVVTYTASQISQAVGGTIVGDPSRQVTCLAPLDAPVQNCLTFFGGQSARALLSQLNQNLVGAIFVPLRLQGKLDSLKLPVIHVENPLGAIIKITPYFFETTYSSPSISSKAEIDPTATIGKNVSIGAFVSIAANCHIGDGVTIFPHTTIYSGVVIGNNTVIHANCVIREECRIGPDVVIHAGTVIGADGFGYFLENGALNPVPQVGIVEIGAKVEIGANSAIDRATLGITKIGPGTKIDNLVQIGHNVSIGANSIICGQVGIAGSSIIGSGVVLGGSVGVADHVTIPDGTRVAGGSGVTGDLEKGDYAGYPAINASVWRRQVTALAKLPQLINRLKAGKKG